MKIINVKSKKEKRKCVDFLMSHESRNLYLHERFTSGDMRYCNLCFKNRGGTRGVINTINGRQIHIFLAKDSHQKDICEIADYLFNRFPMVKSFFGDKESVSRLLKFSRVEPVKTKEFIFMELDGGNFNRHPSDKRSTVLESVNPRAEMASALLPLLINYEVEELGVDPGIINRSKMLIVLRKRIERGEMTALLDDGRPVAFAGVNARFRDVCQVGGVYVLPRYRGKGYGYFIVESHLERLFRFYSRIVLFVSTDNKKALRLYRNVGFSPSGELKQAFVPLSAGRGAFNKTVRSELR